MATPAILSFWIMEIWKWVRYCVVHQIEGNRILFYCRHKSTWNSKIMKHLNGKWIKCEVTISRACAKMGGRAAACRRIRQCFINQSGYAKRQKFLRQGRKWCTDQWNCLLPSRHPKGASKLSFSHQIFYCQEFMMRSLYECGNATGFSLPITFYLRIYESRLIRNNK